MYLLLNIYAISHSVQQLPFNTLISAYLCVRKSVATNFPISFSWGLVRMLEQLLLLGRRNWNANDIYIKYLHYLLYMLHLFKKIKVHNKQKVGSGYRSHCYVETQTILNKSNNGMRKIFKNIRSLRFSHTNQSFWNTSCTYIYNKCISFSHKVPFCYTNALHV